MQPLSCNRKECRMADIVSDMIVLDNSSEVVRYTVPDIPIHSMRSTQADYPTLCVVNHWHTDLEFNRVTRGRVFYCINGERVEIREGDMIFVNSTRMHYSFWEQKEDCELVCTIFHPGALGAAAEKYGGLLFGENAPAYILFKSAIPAEKALINRLSALHEACAAERGGSEFFIMREMYAVCGLLYDFISGMEAPPAPHDKKKLEALHRMTGFIQQNYAGKLTLAEIAAAGLVCRSGCCEIFRTYLDTSPLQFLNEYRIQKGIELLTTEKLSVTEAAARCGFSGASYFAEMFRRSTGKSPKEYAALFSDRQ